MGAEVVARVGALLLLALLAGGCGMKGDLYHPEREVPAAPEPAGEPDDEDAEVRRQVPQQ